jgi:hypothetical protein
VTINRSWGVSLVAVFALATAGPLAGAFSTGAVGQTDKPAFNATNADAAAVEVSRTPYEQYVSRDCFVNPCSVDFASVPPRRRLEISNTSCYIQATTTSSILYAQLYTKKADGTFVAGSTLAPILVAAAAGFAGTDRKVWSANHPISAHAAATQFFQAAVQMGTGSTLIFIACHISGYMVKLG